MSTPSAAVLRRRIERVEALSLASAIARQDRDAAIVAAREAGLSLRAIAEAAGVTHRTVHMILERQAA